MSNRIAPELGNIVRTQGIAGQFQYAVAVTYPGEATRTVLFAGTAYGPTVVMVTETDPGGQRVIDPERFGDALTPEWIRRFYA